MLKYFSLSARWARAVREAWRAPPWHVEMRGIVVEVSFSYMRSCLFACSRRAGPRHVRVRSCVARYARRRTPPRTSACSAYHILSRAECVLVRLRRWACIRGVDVLYPWMWHGVSTLTHLHGSHACLCVTASHARGWSSPWRG